MIEPQTGFLWSVEDWNRNLFVRWAGLRVIQAKDGFAEIELTVGDHHRGGGRTSAVNGAIQAYTHDVIQGVAISSLFDPAIQRMATLHLNIEYPKLLLADHVITATAKVLRLGSNVAFCDSEFLDAKGDICSRCTGTYLVKRSRSHPSLGVAPV
jgi:uncharacterized protein (TIGR00369 family)